MERKHSLAVIGAGPVGAVLSAHLARAGHEVLLVESDPKRLAQLRQHGLRITGVLDVARQRPVLLASVSELAGRKVHALFICTKAWSLKTLLPELRQVLDANTLIVSFQNGIGPEDQIAEQFERERVCRGIVNFAGGVAPDGDGVTVQWFTPPNYLGPLDGGGPYCEELSGLLSSIDLHTQPLPTLEVKKKVFYKTILNSALNALCASSGITMRQAMSFPHTRNLAELLIREGLSVAAAVGYYYGENSMAECLAYLDRGGDHLPSMWVDLQRGLPTEIEYINGRIVQVGRMFRNLAVDVNVFFTTMIVTLEIKSGARMVDDIPDYLRRD